MSVTSELIALRNKEGLIVPPEVVRWAERHPNSDIHGALEWDNGVAGNLYRVNQVRQLIAIHLVDTSGERTWVSLSVDRVSGSGYRNLKEGVLPIRNLREILLHDAIEELKRLRAKYERLEELVAIWKAMDDLPPPGGKGPKKGPKK